MFLSTLLVLMCMAGADPLSGVPEITDRSRWKQYILPTATESAWRDRIPWLADFGGGLRLAAAEDKPVLLWVMNGHPLGCT